MNRKELFLLPVALVIIFIVYSFKMSAPENSSVHAMTNMLLKKGITFINIFGKSENESTSTNVSEPSDQLAYKYINFIDLPTWFPHLQFERCTVNRCRARKGWKNFNESDALFYYGVNFHVAKKPPRQSRNQVWIVAAWESPYHTHSNRLSRPVWKNQMNWTMTYRLDSDIYVPYGRVKKVTRKKSADYNKIMSKKTSLVAWVVGNCKPPSKRMAYVRHLQKDVPVDIFGNCGPNRTRVSKDIFSIINEKYKFYLAFENSLCVDYITEKFFARQGLNLIVIVRGSGNYSQLYPSKSYIDTRDFKNSSELSRYIRYLDKNNTAYLEYLKAKENYTSVLLGSNISRGLCKLCEMLHEKNLHRNVYEDFSKWWSVKLCNSNPVDI